MRARLLGLAVSLTVLAVLLDLSGAGDLGAVRGAAAAVLGPLERAAGPAADPAREAQVRAAGEAVLGSGREPAEVAGLLGSPALDGATVVLGRVVAVGAAGPAGPERVTIDVGSRDGVEAGRMVVAPDGLVGRVVGVAPWTSDVALLGGPEVTVGVRVGSRGVLGEATATAAPGAPAPDPGLLSLELVQRGVVADGDEVTTLGSVGDTPYLPGVLVGTVTATDPGAGRLAPTGVVTPSVDTTSLDVVAVVVGGDRSTPRPVVTGGG